MEKLNLLSDLVINELFMEGFYVGLFVTFCRWHVSLWNKLCFKVI